MKVVGYIVRRRPLGKTLAFADIQVEQSDDDDDGKAQDATIFQVVFGRDSPSWNKDYDDTFPTKQSALPYGAKVRLDLVEKDNRFEVHTWEILSDPRDVALEAAKQKGVDGSISCTTYLKARSDAFLRFNQNPTVETRSNKKPSSGVESSGIPTANTTTNTSTGTEGENAHGDSRAKGLRAKIFASWLIDKFGADHLSQNGGVLDIAGGKGKLSVELALQSKIQSCIIDPLVRKHGNKRKESKQIQKANAPPPNHIAKPFNQTTFLDEFGVDLLERASICVGLHPDECTEDILDVGLKYGKELAIVPCCVFSGFFPLRELRCGTSVRTYEQLLQYLLEKDDRLRMETLPFHGKNQVIYYKEECK
jgi:hypothetical protein